MMSDSWHKGTNTFSLAVWWKRQKGLGQVNAFSALISRNQCHLSAQVSAFCRGWKQLLLTALLL